MNVRDYSSITTTAVGTSIVVNVPANLSIRFDGNAELGTEHHNLQWKCQLIWYSPLSKKNRNLKIGFDAYAGLLEADLESAHGTSLFTKKLVRPRNENGEIDFSKPFVAQHEGVQLEIKDFVQGYLELIIEEIAKLAPNLLLVSTYLFQGGIQGYRNVVRGFGGQETFVSLAKSKLKFSNVALSGGLLYFYPANLNSLRKDFLNGEITLPQELLTYEKKRGNLMNLEDPLERLLGMNTNPMLDRLSFASSLNGIPAKRERESAYLLKSVEKGGSTFTQVMRNRIDKAQNFESLKQALLMALSEVETGVKQATEGLAMQDSLKNLEGFVQEEQKRADELKKARLGMLNDFRKSQKASKAFVQEAITKESVDDFFTNTFPELPERSVLAKMILHAANKAKKIVEVVDTKGVSEAEAVLGFKLKNDDIAKLRKQLADYNEDFLPFITESFRKFLQQDEANLSLDQHLDVIVSGLQANAKNFGISYPASQMKNEFCHMLGEFLLTKTMPDLAKNSAITREEAIELSKKIEFEFIADDPRPESQKDYAFKDTTLNEYTRSQMVENVKSQLIFYHQMTGGEVKTIQKVKIHENPNFRANASLEGRSINISIDDCQSSTAIFHEALHHLEFSNPTVHSRGQALWMSKAKSFKTKEMSKLTGNKNYRSSEVSIESNASHPYLMKMYDRSGENPLDPENQDSHMSSEVITMCGQDLSPIHKLFGSLGHEGSMEGFKLAGNAIDVMYWETICSLRAQLRTNPEEILFAIGLFKECSQGLHKAEKRGDDVFHEKGEEGKIKAAIYRGYESEPHYLAVRWSNNKAPEKFKIPDESLSQNDYNAEAGKYIRRWEPDNTQWLFASKDLTALKAAIQAYDPENFKRWDIGRKAMVKRQRDREVDGDNPKALYKDNWQNVWSGSLDMFRYAKNASYFKAERSPEKDGLVFRGLEQYSNKPFWWLLGKTGELDLSGFRNTVLERIYFEMGGSEVLMFAESGPVTLLADPPKVTLRDGTVIEVAAHNRFSGHNGSLVY